MVDYKPFSLLLPTFENFNNRKFKENLIWHQKKKKKKAFLKNSKMCGKWMLLIYEKAKHSKRALTYSSLFYFFMATPMPYGGPWARGQIGTTAATYTTAAALPDP